MSARHFHDSAGPRLSFGPDTKLPGPDKVRAWWDAYGMLGNIRAHSEMVTKVAMVIAGWLAEAGVELNRQAVQVGALAHDIAKTQCLGSERLHFFEGEEILREKGYPELAYLVGRHVILPQDHPLDETMVVNYADKRVRHDQVVDLKARFEYIAERYGKKDPKRLKSIQKGYERALAVEKTIFAKLKGRHAPEDIDRMWQEGKF